MSAPIECTVLAASVGSRSLRSPGRWRAALVQAAALVVLAIPGCAPPASGTSAVSASPAVADTSRGTVVLLHGLGRSERSMRPLERALAAEGYRVVNLGYPSREYSVGQLVDTLTAELDRCCGPAGPPMDFVTHSLGGILLRSYSALHGAERIGRVVMLSPPNKGSQVVDRLPDRLLELVLGPASLQLGTDSTSVPVQLPPVDFELGIITGAATLNPLFSYWLPGADDGTVSVDHARVEGASDFLVLPYSHSFIMYQEEVIEEVLAFLAHGEFTGDGASADGGGRP